MINLFIVCFLIFIIYIYIENKYNDVDFELSTFDNRSYLVRNLDDKKDAANLLAKVRENLEKLCKYLKKKYADDEGVERLIIKFDPEKLSETSGNSKYTSYSVNKGEKIVLCLRARGDNDDKLIDENTLMFVALHELSHIMTTSIGHKKDFWKNFKFLLNNAIELQIYKKDDYNNSPKKYCGIMITDTPLNDSSI